jgi:Fe2+ transport system protein FeoA
MTLAAHTEFEHSPALVTLSNKTLAALPVGASAVIVRVRCARSIAVRLMEMGLLPGTRVTLVRVAPLGDPIELRVRGYALSIRRAEAELVDVDGVEEGSRP